MNAVKKLVSLLTNAESFLASFSSRRLSFAWTSLDPIRFDMDALETRVLFSQTNVMLVEIDFHGTNLYRQQVVFGGGGHGFGSDMRQAANVQYAVSHALNPADRVFDIDWGSLGDPAKAGHAAAVAIESALQKSAAPIDVLTLGYSRGCEPEEVCLQDLAAAMPSIRRILNIALVPTGIKVAGDKPLQLVANQRIHNVVYENADGKRPYWASQVVETTFPASIQTIPLQVTTGNPSNPVTDAKDEHEQFLNYYVTSGRAVADLTGFEETTPSQAAIAGKAAATALALPTDVPSQGVTEIYIPGGGPGFALPFLIDAVKNGIKVVADEVGNEIGVAINQAGHLVTTFATSPGRFVADELDSAGNVLSEAAFKADSILDAAEDVVKHGLDFLKHLLPW